MFAIACSWCYHNVWLVLLTWSAGLAELISGLGLEFQILGLGLIIVLDFGHFGWI